MKAVKNLRFPQTLMPLEIGEPRIQSPGGQSPRPLHVLLSMCCQVERQGVAKIRLTFVS